MVLKCIVCKIESDETNSSDVSFHKLPASEGSRKEWLQVLTKHCPPITQKYVHVCSQHFKKHCFQYGGMCQRRMLKSGSVPTIFQDFEIVKCAKQGGNQSPGSVSRPQTTNKGFTQVENDLKFPQTDINSDSIFSMPSSDDTPKPLKLDKIIPENEMMQSIRQQNTQIAKLKRQNKSLKVTVGRYRKRVSQYKQLFEALRRRKYISDSETITLQEAIASDDRRDFDKLLSSGQTKGPLPSFLRKFACTLDFYSPKAYTYACRTFIKRLPHQKTISKWYRNVRIGSGISKEVIETVKRKVSKSTWPVFCNLGLMKCPLKRKLKQLMELSMDTLT